MSKKSVSFDDTVTSTQPPESEDERFDEEQSFPAEGSNYSLTQPPSDQERLLRCYEDDPSSIDCPHLLACEVNENGNKTLVPKHFFIKDCEVSVGSGYKNDSACDIAFPGMHAVGMSNVSFIVSFVQDRSPALTLDVKNSCSLTVKHALNGRITTIKDQESQFPVANGDEITFVLKGNLSLRALRFVVPNEATPDPKLDAARVQALKTVECEMEQCRARVMVLENTSKKIQEAADVESISELVDSIRILKDNTGSGKASELVGSKHGIQDGNKSPQPKRQRADQQELRRFHQLQHEVITARRLLQSAPSRPSGKKKKRQVQGAKDLLSKARSTPCYFAYNGGCRNGSSCPFKHPAQTGTTDDLDSVQLGVLKKWIRSGPNGAYGFIQLNNSDKELYCTARGFMLNDIGQLRSSLPVSVGRVIHQRNKKPGQLDIAEQIRLN